jgi:hypothetical protein
VVSEILARRSAGVAGCLTFQEWRAVEELKTRVLQVELRHGWKVERSPFLDVLWGIERG